MNIIRTERIDLVPATPEFIKLLVADEYVRAGDLLNVVVPDSWPNDDDARAGLAFHLKAIQRNSAELHWRIRLIVLRTTRTIIGSINLKGLPDERGTVEVGWGVSPEYRRQGLAMEAAEAIIEWVCSQPEARRIIATIPADNPASIRVAERLGMNATGEFRRNLPVWELDCTMPRLTTR
ncbi:MAG TPA: GNAT family N-acetyltransferase [Pyrinomonadaceae bacterium]|nr:GNAT family N-acetyltransferase [Pyrinomonadaceae bacterium]